MRVRFALMLSLLVLFGSGAVCARTLHSLGAKSSLMHKSSKARKKRKKREKKRAEAARQETSEKSLGEREIEHSRGK